MKRLSNTDQNENALTNVPDGVDAGDAVNKGQLDTKADDSEVVKLTGGTLTGALTGTSASFSSSATLSSTAGTNTSGLIFGTDTNLYRSAADTLTTDDHLVVTGTSTSVNDRAFLVKDSVGDNLVSIRNNGRISMEKAGDLVATSGNWFLQANHASIYLRPTSQNQNNALRITGAGGSGTRLFLYSSTGSNQIILEHNGTDGLDLGGTLGVTGDITTDGTVDGLDLAASAKGFINHGATAGTTRPSGYVSVEWTGSVEPTNAIDGDTWIDTSA